MIEKDTILKRLTDAASSGAGRQVELVCLENRTALSRFAENVIHQNIEQADHRVMARVSLGDRIGLAVGNNIEPAAIESAIESATEIAENRDLDPDFPGFIASPATTSTPGAFINRTADFSPAERAAAIKTAVEACSRAGLSASGLFKTETKATTVINSLGTAQYFAETIAEFSLTASDDDAAASGWTVGYHRDARQIDLVKLIKTAVDKAVASRNPQPHPAGDYTGAAFVVPGFPRFRRTFIRNRTQFYGPSDGAANHRG